MCAPQRVLTAEPVLFVSTVWRTREWSQEDWAAMPRRARRVAAHSGPALKVGLDGDVAKQSHSKGGKLQ